MITYMGLLVQRFFARFCALVLKIYYDEIVVRGEHNCPEGPLILAANHPNMLMDPVVIATSISSHITSPFAFWAKSTLFKGFQGRILSLLGAVPVQRQQDLQSPTTQHIDNTLLFGSSIEALREKRVLLLFPEGVSYTESHMQPLKTGAARVAQEYFTTHKSSVPIVPVGLNYIEKEKFRSHVYIEFGAPLHLDQSISDPKEQVRDLTHRLDVALHALTINAPDFATLLDLRLAKSVLVDGRTLSLDQTIEMTRRIASLYEQKKDQPEILLVKSDISQYRQTLESLGLQDWQVRLGQSSKLHKFILWNLVYSILLLPFAVFGFLMHLPVFLLTRYANKKVVDVEEKSQSKLLIISVLVPLQYFLLLASILFFFGTLTFLWCLLFVPIIGYFLIVYVSHERQSFKALLQLIWLALLLNNSTVMLQQLLEKRKQIKAALDAIAQRYLAETGAKSILADVRTVKEHIIAPQEKY